MANLHASTKTQLILSYHKEDDGQVWVTIYDARRETRYDVNRVASDWGTCYRWEKFLFDVRGSTDKEYYVLLSDEGRDDRCTCPGYHYRGTCRHLEATREMKERKLLP